MRFGGIVNGQIVPHELGVHSYMFHEAISAADNEVPAVVDEIAEVPKREADAAANVEEIFAVILGVRRNKCAKQNCYSKEQSREAHRDTPEKSELPSASLPSLSLRQN
jgi:hypothetical protein